MYGCNSSWSANLSTVPGPIGNFLTALAIVSRIFNADFSDLKSLKPLSAKLVFFKKSARFSCFIILINNKR